jgi:hypothetical protein
LRRTIEAPDFCGTNVTAPVRIRKRPDKAHQNKLEFIMAELEPDKKCTSQKCNNYRRRKSHGADV